MLRDETLDRVHHFHSELLGMARTGLPMDLGMPLSLSGLTASLDAIFDRLRISVLSGISVQQAIDRDAQLTSTYRGALHAWLASDGSPTVLESLVAPAARAEQRRRLWTFSLIQPLIILGLAYFSLIFLCTHNVPRFEALYAMDQGVPGRSLAILIALRRSMPIWSVAAPIFAGGAAWWIRHRGRKRWSHSVLVETRGTDRREANGYRIDDGLRRTLLEFREQHMRMWLPPIVLSCIGGVIVFAIGLSVFGPMVEFLLRLAKEGPHR